MQTLTEPSLVDPQASKQASTDGAQALLLVSHQTEQEEQRRRVDCVVLEFACLASVRVSCFAYHIDKWPHFLHYGPQYITTVTVRTQTSNVNHTKLEEGRECPTYANAPSLSPPLSMLSTAAAKS